MATLKRERQMEEVGVMSSALAHSRGLLPTHTPHAIICLLLTAQAPSHTPLTLLMAAKTKQLMQQGPAHNQVPLSQARWHTA